MQEGSFDDGSEFFASDVRRAGAAEDLSMRLEAVSGGGKKAHIGFFSGRNLSLRGGKTGGVGDDEIERGAFRFSFFEPVEHVAFSEDVFGGGDARDICVQFVVFLDEIERVSVAVEAPDGRCAADGGVDGKAAGIAADIEDFFVCRE